MFFHHYLDSVKYTSYSTRPAEVLSCHHKKMRRHMTCTILHATSRLRPCLNTSERSLSYKESHAPKPKPHFLQVERLQLSSISLALFVRSANMQQRSWHMTTLRWLIHSLAFHTLPYFPKSFLNGCCFFTEVLHGNIEWNLRGWKEALDHTTKPLTLINPKLQPCRPHSQLYLVRRVKSCKPSNINCVSYLCTFCCLN